MRPTIKTYRPGDVYKYAHLKRDGIWLTLMNCGGRGCMALTRHPTNITHQLREHPVFQRFQENSTDGQELYCELFAPSDPSALVKSHLALGNMHKLRIEAFATPNLPSYAPLCDVAEYADALDVPFAQWWLGDDDSGMDAEDSEGLVYKDGNLLNWAKRKAILTTDLVITGYTEGRGKYAGLIGAIELSLCTGRVQDELTCAYVTRVSGMDDVARREISENREKYLGKVVEINFQRRDSAGGLRHPRFKCFRDDKLPEECTKI